MRVSFQMASVMWVLFTSFEQQILKEKGLLWIITYDAVQKT